MEFAGKEFIYLPKIKKDKIRKIRKAEEDNKGEAPMPLPNNSDKKKFLMLLTIRMMIKLMLIQRNLILI